MVLPTKIGHNAWGQTALLIEITYKNDPKCISADIAKSFYELVETNQNKKDFVVTRSKPGMNIADKACFVDFIYNIELFNQHLCTVFEFDCFGGGLNFYDVEFQNQYYSDRDLTMWLFKSIDYKKYKSIGDMVVARWNKDEEKRKAELNKKTNTDAVAFLGSFIKEKQYQ
ncbi:MAG: hypothetical protein J5714_03755 [Alphaproteobacteria bacterium]|nr:hypothetical protein [Alphaproteobacteria bacterium]